MSKSKEQKKETRVALDAQTKAAVRALATALKAEDKSRAKVGEALGALTDAAAAWMAEHPDASKALVKAYKAEVSAALAKAYPDAPGTVRARLSMVWRVAPKVAEHGSREAAAEAMGATGTGLDALYKAAKPASTGGSGSAKGSAKSAPTRGTPGLSLPAATVEALTANDVAALTMLAKGLATVDAKRISDAIAGIVARLDDKARDKVKQAILAAC